VDELKKLIGQGWNLQLQILGKFGSVVVATVYWEEQVKQWKIVITEAYGETLATTYTSHLENVHDLANKFISKAMQEQENYRD
jgi:hypothetical protein